MGVTARPRQRMLSLLLLLTTITTTTITTSRQIYLQTPVYHPYHTYQPYPHMFYYLPQAQPFLPPVVPQFKIEVSKPLEKEEDGVVLLENDGEVSDLADQVDIIELTEDEALECLTEGSFPHPVYCDKYYTCTEQAGELEREDWQCEAGQLYNPLLLVCQEEDRTVGASLLSRIWISSSLQVTCSLTSSPAS